MGAELLVVGVDPGMTAAYAALNLKGELVKLKSAKHLTMGVILHELAQAGKIIAVGTDVKYSPHFVEKICAKWGARLIAPKEDMKVGYKKRFTENYRYNDDHQRDALAAALFAYREISPLFKRVDDVLKKEGKEHLAYDVKLLAIKGMSIADAISKLEVKKGEPRIKKRMREKGKKSDRIMEVNRALKQENDALKDAIRRLEHRMNCAKRQVDVLVQEKMKKMMGTKEKNLREANERLLSFKKETAELRAQLNDMQNILFSISHKLVVKRLKNLSRQEINRLNRQDRIILVDDASIFSEQALESMRDHVSTIIIKSKAPSFVSKLPFSLVNAKDVILEERENFAVIGKASLEKQKERADILQKIVAEYKEARNVQL